jgi:hypothetical protein
MACAEKSLSHDEQPARRCALMILTATDHRLAFLTFAAGSTLGYFLER